MTRAWAAVAGILLLGLPLDGQQPPPIISVPGGATPGAPVPQGARGMPPRDTQQKPGSAVIRGRVFAADTGQPLRKAVVRAGGAELREGRVATTDEQGRYELK